MGNDWDPAAQVADVAANKLNMKLGVRKELKTLPKYLAEGEQVVNMSDGMYGSARGLVFCTDRRVGFLSAGMGRSKFEDFPYDKISSVQHSTGMAFGELTVFASGNKAELTQMIKQRAPEIADYVRSQIGNQGAATAPAAAPAPPSDADQIRQLAGLRDQGLLTDDEFEAKKRQILGL